MKLGIWLETNYSSENNKLFCLDIYSLIINRLSEEYEIYFIGKKKDNLNAQKYELNNYQQFYEIEPYESLVSLCLNYRSYIRRNKSILDTFVKDMDSLLIMTPSPISIELIKLAILNNKNIVLLVRQDTRSVIPQRFSGVKKIMSTIMANYLESSVENLTKRHQLKVLALGPVLAERYGKFTRRTKPFASSRYRKKDVIKPEQINDIDLNSKLRLLFVGRLEINKGIKELLLAIHRLNHIDYELTIIGDGSYRKDAEVLVSQLDLSEKVVFKGYKPYSEELLDIYRSHDIFILPSYSEGLPQVVLEAMASGCLVFSTPVGSVPKIINHKVNGFLFKPHSVDSLVEVFNELNEVSLKEIRLAALNTAKEYAYENQIKVMKDCIVSNCVLTAQ